MQHWKFQSISLVAGVALVLAFGGSRCALAQEASGGGAATVRVETTRYYENALRSVEAQKYAEAIIQLKNALQLDPKHLAARILLGKALLEDDQPRAAVEELVLAKDLGGDPSLIDAPLAEAYLQLGKLEEVLHSLDPKKHPDAQAADLHVLRGRAYIALGNVVMAASEFEAARALDPTAQAPLLGRVMVLLLNGKLERASKLIDEVIAEDAENAEAWLLKGKLARSQGRVDEVGAAFSRALELKPDYTEALLSRAALSVELGDFDLARKDLDTLTARSIVEPMAVYLRAVVYAHEGDKASAQELLERADEIIGKIPEAHLRRNPQTLLVAGTVSFFLGRTEEAVAYLNIYLAGNPDHPRANELKGRILLDRGDAAEALYLIEPVQRRFPEDVRLQVLMGRIYLATKDYEASSRMFEQATAHGPQDISVQWGLARSYIGGRQIDNAVGALDTVMELDEEASDAVIAKALLLLKRGESTMAIAAVQQVLAQEPRHLLALNLLGSARLVDGDIPGSRAAFGRALEVDPNYLAAKLNLAKVDIEEGLPEQARKRYMEILDQVPDQTTTLLGIARLEEILGNGKEAIRWRERLRELLPDNIDANLKLIDLYIRSGDPDSALRIAQTMEASHPNDFRVQLALGVSEDAAGKRDDARVTFRKLSRRASYDADELYRIAAHQARIGDSEFAKWSLIKAVEAQPDGLAAKVGLAEVQLELGDLDDALELSLRIQREFSDLAVGHRLEGDAAVALKDYVRAEQAYLRGEAIKPGSTIAQRLYHTRSLDGRQAEAIAGLEVWVDKYPGDYGSSELLAKALLQVGRYGDALPIYERLIEGRPDDASLLNNLAVLYDMEGDPRALGLAEKAYGLSPEDPLIADTLGWFLVKRGQVKEGMYYLREAQSRAALMPDVGYHIAAGLHEQGRDADARRELERALAIGQEFPEKAAAEELLRQLSEAP